MQCGNSIARLKCLLRLIPLKALRERREMFGVELCENWRSIWTPRHPQTHAGHPRTRNCRVEVTHNSASSLSRTNGRTTKRGRMSPSMTALTLALSLSQNKYWNCHSRYRRRSRSHTVQQCRVWPPTAPLPPLPGSTAHAGKGEKSSAALISQSERDRFAVNGAI